MQYSNPYSFEKTDVRGRFLLKFSCTNVKLETVSPIAANVTWLCAVGELEAKSINLPPKLNSSTTAELTTLAPIAQNQCCAYVAVNLG